MNPMPISLWKLANFKQAIEFIGSTPLLWLNKWINRCDPTLTLFLAICRTKTAIGRNLFHPEQGNLRTNFIIGPIADIW